MTKKRLLICGALFAILLAGGLYQMNVLRVAHSSFENYYQFRGCTQLLEKQDAYGVCKLAGGETIKLVKVNGKWFLDGDVGGW